MYQRSSIDALSKKTPGLKLRPGVFSDPSNFIAKSYNEDPKKKGKANQQISDISARREKHTGSSYENVFKGSTHMTSENDPLSGVFDNPENFGADYVFNTNFDDLKPLEERVNRLPTRLSVAEKALHSRSDKLVDTHEDIQKNLRRQSSVSSLQRRTYQKNPSNYDNIYPSEIENRENSPNLRVSHMSNGAKSKVNTNFMSYEGEPNNNYNFNRTRSLGKISSHNENTKFKTPNPSITAYTEEKEEQAQLEHLMQENMELWNNSQRLSAELQNEKNRALVLENEVKNLSTSIAEERAKYQEEFIKISHEIKKFQNIQNAYIKEKKTSQALEQQINMHERALGDLSCFVRECLQTLIKELEIIILKGDVAFEKQFRNQEFSPEDFFKFCHELKRPILQKLEAAQKQNFKFEWRTHDYDQLLRYSRELEKLRKAQDFNVLSNKLTFSDESFQKSSINNIINQSHKQSLNSLPSQYNSSHSNSRARNHSNPRSNRNQYKSNDYSAAQDLNKSDLGQYHHESQQKAEKYIPLNYRINLAEFNLQPQGSQADNNIIEDSDPQNFIKRRAVSVPRIHEADMNMQEALPGSQITNPRLKDFSTVHESFDNLLMDGIQSRPEQEVQVMNVEDSNTNPFDMPSLNQRGQFNNELASFSAQVDAGLNSIKSQIMSRMSSIEARRRSSVDGARQFNLDINRMPNQESIHHEFTNRGITEKSNEETTPRTRVMGIETQRGEENLQEQEDLETSKEKPRVIEQSANKSPVSVKAISWSPAPKLNLMAYNTNEERFATLAKSESTATLKSNKEERYWMEREAEEEKGVPNEAYQDMPYKPAQDQYQSYQSNRGSGEYAIANYDYEAQKENDLSFSQGDKIQILKKTENGWWIGLANNRIGYFPSNFVTLVQGNS